MVLYGPDGTDQVGGGKPRASRTTQGGGLIRQPLNFKNHGRLRLRKKLGNRPR